MFSKTDINNKTLKGENSIYNIISPVDLRNIHE